MYTVYWCSSAWLCQLKVYLLQLGLIWDNPVALERGCRVGAVYTDFSKGFYSVNHNLLIAMLEAIDLGAQSVRGSRVNNSLMEATVLLFYLTCFPLILETVITCCMQMILICSELLITSMIPHFFKSYGITSLLPFTRGELIGHLIKLGMS